MSQKIRVETLDGKVLHRTRARAQRLVEAGSHQWKDAAKTTLTELKAQASSSDPHRFLAPNLPIFFDYEYPPDRLPEKDPHYLPYTYPLSEEFLRPYCT